MNTLINDRIDVRISKEQKELIKYASELSGFKSLSEFIIFSINKEAKQIITENNLILKSIEDKKIFLNAIISPPKPNASLKKALLNYQKINSSNESKNISTRKKTHTK